MMARKQARNRGPLKSLAVFASVWTLSLSALAQELLPPLDYSYQEIELPEAMGHYEESKTMLLENDALLFWDFSKSFYRNANGEWIASPGRFEWTRVSSNGYIVGWDRDTETPALWHPESPENAYNSLDELAPSDKAYSPLGVADNGEVLLVDSEPPYYYLWAGDETTPLTTRFPELDDPKYWVLTILPDGSIAGVVRGGLQTWNPFIRSPDGITFQSELSLALEHISGPERFSPNGNVLVRNDGNSTTAWGPSFPSAIMLEFHATDINKHGEIVGSYSSTEYDFEDSVVLWNQQDGLAALNDFINRPDGVPKLWFYESLATNGSRSILVHGLPEEGAFRTAKLYLLKRSPAKERIDSFVTRTKNGNIELTSFAHLRISRLKLMRSTDLKTWEQIDSVDDPGLSPWSSFQIESNDLHGFYRTIGEPNLREVDVP